MQTILIADENNKCILNMFSDRTSYQRGYTVAQLVQALRYSRKVVSSIPECVIGIFH